MQKEIKYKIIHSVYYFDRELFLIEIDGKYTMIYKRSGLNGGQKGSILPFMYLHSELPRFGEMKAGIVSGYIYKDFYFNEKFVSHRKKMESFGSGVNNFLNQLKNDLAEIQFVFREPQDISHVLGYAKDFNNIVKKYIKNKEDHFDWNSLN